MDFFKKCKFLSKVVAIVLVPVTVIFCLNLSMVCIFEENNDLGSQCLSPAVVIESELFIENFNLEYFENFPSNIFSKEKIDFNQEIKKQEKVNKVLNAARSVIKGIKSFFTDFNMNKVIVLASLLYVILVPVSSIVYSMQVVYSMPYADGQTYMILDTNYHVQFVDYNRSRINNVEHDLSVLKDLSDAILQFIMHLTGNSDRPTKGSTAEALENIRKNRVDSNHRNRKSKAEFKKSVDKNTLSVNPKDPATKMLALPSGAVLLCLEGAFADQNGLTLIGQAI